MSEEVRLRGVGPTIEEFNEYPEKLRDAFTKVGALGAIAWQYDLPELDELITQATEILYVNEHKFGA